MKSKIFWAAPLVALALLLASFARPHAAPKAKKTFVLVHGAWAGKYAWTKVKPMLEKEGNKVISFDLPAHGDDQTPLGEATMAAYVKLVSGYVNAEPGPVVLLGHSMGGMVISQVAEAIPDKIEKLVYLSAYLPQNGQFILGLPDAQSLIGPNLVFSADKSSATIKPEFIVPIFAADCPADIQKLVVAQHRPEPLQPSQGQTVVVVELPGHSADQTAPATLTLNSYRDKVVAAITALPGQVVLVGHSLGGMVITQVAEAIPDRINRLVYIGAYLPANGQSLLALANTDATSLLGPAIVPSADQLTLGLPTASLVSIFIEDGSAAVKELVVSNYWPEPAIPFTNPAVLTAANFGRVAKYYIHTTQDHAVGYPLQQRMAAAARITNTYQLNSSHSPFLSMPAEVTALLLTIAK